MCSVIYLKTSPGWARTRYQNQTWPKVRLCPGQQARLPPPSKQVSPLRVSSTHRSIHDLTATEDGLMTEPQKEEGDMVFVLFHGSPWLIQAADH